MAVRVVVLLGLALIIGVGTIIFAKQWIASQTPEPVPPGVVEVEVEPDLYVLVAQGNLQPGMLLGPESVRWQGWPTEDVPPAYAVQGKRTDAEFYGAVVRYPMASGEPITDFKIARPGEQGYVAAVLEPGMRAVAIPISPLRASAGFILPGDRVDVLLTHETGVGSVSETVFFNMKVLAIDQALAAPEGPARVGGMATLEVTPREVEAFTLMQQMGTMSLALRSLQPGESEENEALPEKPAGTPGTEQMAGDAGTEQMAGDAGSEQMAGDAGSEQVAGEPEAMAEAVAGMSEKPEVIEKVPTVFPGEVPEDAEVADGAAAAPVPVQSVENAVGQSLGNVEDMAKDEHSIRREDQTFTATRDISVLIGGGGGGGGSVVVIRGN